MSQAGRQRRKTQRKYSRREVITGRVVSGLLPSADQLCCPVCSASLAETELRDHLRDCHHISSTEPFELILAPALHLEGPGDPPRVQSEELAHLVAEIEQNLAKLRRDVPTLLRQLETDLLTRLNERGLRGFLRALPANVAGSLIAYLLTDIACHPRKKPFRISNANSVREYASLQRAIEALRKGDTLLIAAGLFSAERRHRYSTPEGIIVTAEEPGTVFLKVEDGSPFGDAFDGVRFVQSYLHLGGSHRTSFHRCRFDGGALLASGASLVLSHCEIRGGWLQGVNGSTLQLDHCSVEDSVHYHGNELFAARVGRRRPYESRGFAVGVATSSELILSDCEVVNNPGIGVFAGDDAHHIQTPGSTVGSWGCPSGCRVTLVNTTIRGNGEYGLLHERDERPRIQGCTITQNKLGQIAALSSRGPSARIEGCPPPPGAAD